jgi:hypothetical protein
MMAENDDLTTGDENNPAIPDPGTAAGGADLPTEVTEEPPVQSPTGSLGPVPNLPPSTVPTVPIEATGPGSSAAVPPMPGRTFNDGVTSSAPAVPAPAVAADVGVAEIAMVDPKREKEITAQITDTFRDGLADTLGVARETLAEGAAYFAPMIARQALLQTSADPKVSARAAGHLRHLKSQLLMRAGERGIPLQQRQEQRVLGVMTTVLAIAVRFATGGVA